MAANLLHTLHWLQQIAKQNNEEVLVGLSGGKDSLVVLDMCKRVFKRVECFAMHFLPGMRCFDGPVDAAARRWGVKVHKVQHWTTVNMIRMGVFRPHIKELIVGEKRLPKVTVKDVWAKVREESGIQLIATGERMDESLMRRGQLHKCQGYEQKTARVFPLWDWSGRDVVGYLRAKRIPVPVGTGRRNMSGIDLRPETLRYLKEHFPEDYQIVLDVFPFCEAQFKREEFLANRPPEPEAEPNE